MLTISKQIVIGLIIYMILKELVSKRDISKAVQQITVIIKGFPRYVSQLLILNCVSFNLLIISKSNKSKLILLNMVVKYEINDDIAVPCIKIALVNMSSIICNMSGSSVKGYILLKPYYGGSKFVTLLFFHREDENLLPRNYNICT